MSVVAPPVPHRLARKRPTHVSVRFADAPCAIVTREGPVSADVGDAVVTATTGESWPIARALFESRYEAAPPTVMGEAGDYVSRPWRVRVVQLEHPVSAPAAGGRSHLAGKPGDWLVDYGDGSVGIVAPEIFAATYELEGSDDPR